jgi:cell division protein FtsQ
MAMDAQAFPPEVVVDEEPRYLRRQKPVEIKRRKFGKKAWKLYFRVAVWVLAGGAGAWLLYGVVDFLFASPKMALIHPQQVLVSGTQNASRAAVLDLFAMDRGRSVLLIPLDERRRQLEAMPWIQRATVRRALPNLLQVEIVERVPVAFLRQGTELAMIDEDGIILDRPVEGDFNFPVVTGINAQLPREDRGLRMQMFVNFLHEIDRAHAGASGQVSEVDLSDVHDVRATIAGLPGNSAPAATGATDNTAPAQDNEPVMVHFGDKDFQSKYQSLVENIAQWRAVAGRIESVDLRFNREAVVNPEASATAHRAKPAPAAPKPIDRPAATAATRPAPKLVAKQPAKPAVKHSVKQKPS